MKVLQETAPILFTWWNAESDSAEGCLVTCGCQNWCLVQEMDVTSKKNRNPNRNKLDIKDSSNLGKEGAMKLCRALEQAEILSISSGVHGESILETEACGRFQRGKSKQEDIESIPKVRTGPDLVEGSDIEMNPDKRDEIFKQSQEMDEVCTETIAGNEGLPLSGTRRVVEGGDVDGEGDAQHRTEIRSQTNCETLSQTDSKVKMFIDKESCSSVHEDLTDDVLSEGKEAGSAEYNDVNKRTSLNVGEIDRPVPGDFEKEFVDNGTDRNNDTIDSGKRLSSDVVDEIREPDKIGTGPSDEVHTNIVNNGGICSDTVVVVSDHKELSNVDSLFRVLKGIMDGAIPEDESNQVTSRDLGEAPVTPIHQGDQMTYEEQQNKRYLKKLHEKPKSRHVERAICEICGAISSTLTIRKHMTTCHYKGKRERNYVCEICGQKFFRCENLNRHRRVHSDPKFHCRQCDRSFRQAYQLKAHTKTHSGYQQPPCIRKPKSKKSDRLGDMCKFVLCKKCGLKMDCKSISEHLEKEHGVRPTAFKCSHCGKRLSNLSSLKIHELRHTELTYKCSFCLVTFSSNKDRLKHEKVHTDVISKLGKLVFKCGYCEKEYTRQTDRMRHEMTHVDKTIDPSHVKDRDEEAHVLVDCDLCGKTLREQSMRNHLLSHDHKSWTCKICLKTFTYSYRYQHAKLHQQSKPHACQHCPAKFHSKSALVVHVRKHTKEKPIPCRFCEQTFSRHGARNNHERLHTGERPYQCDLCQKAWRDRPTYMQHMRKHHPGV